MWWCTVLDRELMLGQERDLSCADTQSVGREVDAGLVALEHVQAEQ